MDIVDEFIDRYTKEYDFYDQAGNLAARELESVLQAAGIRSIVTNRAKSITRLRDKCRQRLDKGKKYESVDDIFEDIVDLAGIRVALYFPAESEQVEGIIRRMFNIVERKEFPAPGEGSSKKRFSGYSAVHYRVRLDERKLGDPLKRYALAKMEIQIASILMHAWSEVEHDLIYKPLAGELSQSEHDILDQLNGLVISGEIAREMLQRAGEARVGGSEGGFANHYELAAHLLRHADTRIERQVSESGLGRVDLLFDFITRLEMNAPDQLAPYLEALHSNLELRPLAEQIIDALLAEDTSRYDIYADVRSHQQSSGRESEPDRANYHHQVGIFMTHWVRLERLIQTIAESRGSHRYAAPTVKLLRDLNLLPEELMTEFDQLRRMRNYLVHGIEPLDAMILTEASERIEAITLVIQRYFDESGTK